MPLESLKSPLNLLNRWIEWPPAQPIIEKRFSQLSLKEPRARGSLLLERKRAFSKGKGSSYIIYGAGSASWSVVFIGFSLEALLVLAIAPFPIAGYIVRLESSRPHIGF